MERVGRDLDELHADAVEISDVGEDRLGRADVDVGCFGPALFEHRVCLFLVVDDDAEMADAERAAICGLNLHKGVLADLHIDELHFTLVVLRTERFREAEGLRVVLNRLVEIRHDDADVIHTYHTFVRAEWRILGRRGMNCDSTNDKTGNEQSNSAHDHLPCSKMLGAGTDDNTPGSEAISALSKSNRGSQKTLVFKPLRAA